MSTLDLEREIAYKSELGLSLSVQIILVMAVVEIRIDSIRTCHIMDVVMFLVGALAKV